MKRETEEDFHSREREKKRGENFPWERWGYFVEKRERGALLLKEGGGALASIGSRKRNSLLEREKNPPLERERRSSIVVSLSPDSRS